MAKVKQEGEIWLSNRTTLSLPLLNWPVRLRARTPPFHGGDTGSNPVRATKPSQPVGEAFLMRRRESSLLDGAAERKKSRAPR